MHARRALGALTAAATLLTACAGGLGIDVSRIGASPSAPASPVAPIDPGTQPIAAVVERVSPAVVNVTTNLASEAGFGGGGRGTGTGFIVREDGVVVSNFHVVDGAFSIEVFTASGDRYPARVIGGDPNADLAVLQVEASGLPTVELGDSDALRLGESVVALGFALGLEGGPSVTSGIVSQVGRTITAGAGATTNTLEDLIQTDAAINPGNSGGPLVDLGGRVVGINTAAAQAAENIGFAIAINRARPIIEESMENPEAAAAYLGVSTSDLDAVTALQLGLEVDEGALVIDVAPGTAADEAGLRPRDVIIGIAGTTIADSADVSNALRQQEPGDTVELTVIREGGPITLEATLGARPLPTG